MTPLKIKFLMLFLALQAGLLSAQEDIASFTLDEAIQYAQANHSEIRLERLNAADAAKQVKEYKSTGIPQVHGTGNWTHFIDIPTQILPDFTGSGAGLTALQFGLKNSVTAGVEVSALIFDGSFLVGLQAQRLYLELTQKQVNVKAHELKDRVTKAYLAALIAEKNIELLDDNIRSLESARPGPPTSPVLPKNSMWTACSSPWKTCKRNATKWRGLLR